LEELLGSSPIFLSFVACCADPWTKAPSLRRHCPASSVLRAHPPPQPGRPVPRGRPVGRPTPATAGASRVALRSPHTNMPSPLPRQDRRSLRNRSLGLRRRRPSPCVRRVGSRVKCFEACSAFTHVTACSLARSPCDPLPRRLQPVRYLPDCSRCYRVERSSSRAGLAPAENRRLCTAHGRHTNGTSLRRL
jgi:hypothetical protein